ncbi:MAG TPA: sulfite exporter TauE/SafE family protein [Bryobacteraceae bacterium]|nr:sulfite exporter TauE/SafE family protein [Bryobacteraceae bacterium]
MTPIEFSAMFGLGLVSSLHCVQMCGPIVLSYSLPLAKSANRNQLIGAHAAYNLGRITTYSALGAAAGLMGGALNVATRLAGFANGARIGAGLAMIVAAVLISGALPRSGLIQIAPVGVFSRAASRTLLSPQPASKFRLGLLLGFMPCGLVYAALLKSVETGTAANGALSMLAFGLGTVAALAGIGLVSSKAGLHVGRWSNVISAASLAVMGVFLAWRGIAGPVIHAHHC